MWPTFLNLWPTLSGNAPERPAPLRRPAFPRPSCRPRLEALEDRCLLSAGALDPTFGNGAGYITTSLSNHNDWATSILIQPDGKILASGNDYADSNNGSSPEVFAVVRYNVKVPGQPDGSL